MRVKSTAKQREGSAFIFGITRDGSEGVSRTVSVSDLTPDKYQVFATRALELEPDDLFRLCLIGEKPAVSAVSLDCYWLRKEPKE